MRDDEENLTIRPVSGLIAPVDLAPLSVAALREYVTSLNAEIVRVEETIRHKDAARGHADGFFRKAP